MEPFEDLLSAHRGTLERFVRYRLPSQTDADDVLQEVYMTAYRKFDTLKSTALFKAWIISIARNKCRDYFREKARVLEIPLDTVTETQLTYGPGGVTETTTVRETLNGLGNQAQQILYLYYFKELPQTEIAARLGVPLGTVKSRLYAAKERFRERYPYPPRERKGDFTVKKLPELLPEYRIVKSEEAPFAVKWEELPGMLIVPKPGEKLCFGMYDLPIGKRTGMYELETLCKINIHGIDGMEIRADYHSPEEDLPDHRYMAQLTDTHCRYLGEIYTDKSGIRRYLTFLDGDDFLTEWGIGKDNCGRTTSPTVGNRICELKTGFLASEAEEDIDIVGRFDITINGKSYDTIRVITLEGVGNASVMVEQYLDANGRTILWRRFNRDDWAFDRYRQKWSDKLPVNERVTINGVPYVHWYDCITDYLL
ncbi:MAG: RNA polymerase sigma factor [Clostridiaceae bacterium]|nr:RNA polymerase sigma factor [Clostridiaceae bacterium]